MARAKPKAGGVVPGNFTFFDSGLTVTFEGLDANGNALSTGIDLATTCASQSASCAFTCDVLAAVPEPSTYALMAVGLLVLGQSAARSRMR